MAAGDFTVLASETADALRASDEVPDGAMVVVGIIPKKGEGDPSVGIANETIDSPTVLPVLVEWLKSAIKGFAGSDAEITIKVP